MSEAGRGRQTSGIQFGKCKSETEGKEIRLDPTGSLLRPLAEGASGIPRYPIPGSTGGGELEGCRNLGHLGVQKPRKRGGLGSEKCRMTTKEVQGGPRALTEMWGDLSPR